MDKVAENVKVVNAMTAQRLAAATVFYNGYPITFGAVGIDTLGYNSAEFVLNVGTVLGAVATLINQVYESTTNDPTAATLVTGASFTSATSASTAALQEGAIQCENTNRYLFLRTEVQGAPMTIDFGAVAILGNAKNLAVSKTLVFDLEA
jgi:hypothetical protein